MTTFTAIETSAKNLKKPLVAVTEKKTACMEWGHKKIYFLFQSTRKWNDTTIINVLSNNKRRKKKCLTKLRSVRERAQKHINISLSWRNFVSHHSALSQNTERRKKSNKVIFLFFRGREEMERKEEKVFFPAYGWHFVSSSSCFIVF